MSIVPVKFSFMNILRRGQLEVPTSLQALHTTAASLYPELAAKSTALQYVDDDGDVIHVSSQAEVEEALRVMSGKVKFTLIEARDSPATATLGAEFAVHAGVACDRCGVSPIVGVRHKCSVRDDYDLCAACEAQEVQPFPTIKIYTPEQAPKAIVVAMGDRDESSRREARREERWGAGGGHAWRPWEWSAPPHPRHEHPRHEHPPHLRHGGRGPAPEGGRGEGGRGGRGKGGRGGGRGDWSRWGPDGPKGAEDLNSSFNRRKAYAHDVAAAEAASIASHKSYQPPSDAEEALIAEATRRSLSDDDAEGDSVALAEANFAGAPTSLATVVSVTPRSAMTNSTGSVKSLDSSTASLVMPQGPGKPMARFVRDVTYPDGTTVQPNTVFAKTWRIRNDGSSKWSAGCLLTNAGGDNLLQNPTLEMALPQLEVGEEADVTVQLDAPPAIGRHVGYFRCRTADGAFFGQRLWCDIRVNDDASGWHVISGAAATAAAFEEQTPIAREIAREVPASAVDLSVFSRVVEGIEDAHLSDAVSFADEQAWVKELRMLADMGFTDAALNVCLLKEYIVEPVSSSHGSQVPPPEKMQLVIAQLLARSGLSVSSV